MYTAVMTLVQLKTFQLFISISKQTHSAHYRHLFAEWTLLACQNQNGCIFDHAWIIGMTFRHNTKVSKQQLSVNFDRNCYIWYLLTRGCFSVPHVCRSVGTGCQTVLLKYERSWLVQTVLSLSNVTHRRRMLRVLIKID